VASRLTSGGRAARLVLVDQSAPNFRRRILAARADPPSQAHRSAPPPSADGLTDHTQPHRDLALLHGRWQLWGVPGGTALVSADGVTEAGAPRAPLRTPRPRGDSSVAQTAAAEDDRLV
jgi:hypothetical protein